MLRKRTKTIRKKVTTLNISTLKQGNFPLLKNAQIVFMYAVNSVSSFYIVYQKGRKGSAGSTTHEEQDLLRAMLVFACSGLDAVVKQLIKDSLPEVINKDSQGKGARLEFQKFVERRMKKANTIEGENKIPLIDTNFVAEVLTSNEPRAALFSFLQRSLIENSLQSKDQLLKVAAHFAITKDQILREPVVTQEAFDARNDIIHEMDVDLSGKGKGRKKRQTRGVSDMIKYCENILNIVPSFINLVAERIYGPTSKVP